MKRYIVSALAALVVFLTQSLLSKADSDQAVLVPGTDYVRGELIVVFSEAAKPTSAQVRLTGSPRFGVPNLDSFLSDEGVTQLRRPVTSYDQCQSEGGRRLERTYLIKLPPETDLSRVKSALSQMSHFESVRLNRKYVRVFGSLKRFEPPTTTDFFTKQWNLDDLTNDKIDIDMPEAWEIERFDSNIVIVIHDSGAMINLDEPAGINLHHDFNHYWNEAEDNGPGDLLGDADVDQTDADGDGRNDNVIGTNFAEGEEADTLATGEPSDRLAEWRAMPETTILDQDRFADPWDCIQYSDHGTRVASVAAAKISGPDVVGVAFRSSVYWVRAPLSTDTYREVESIVHSAVYGDVINMSWGYGEDVTPDSLIGDAFAFAANDSDCVLVGIVHNDERTDFVQFPAAYDEVLAVGAVNQVGSLDSLIHSYYSNYESGSVKVDVVAPLDEVDGLWGHRHTLACPPHICPCDSLAATEANTTFGTSFAAPQASGLAALLRSRFPGLDQKQIRDRIKRGAEYYWAAADSSKYGAGKINAYRSLTEWGTVKSDTTWGSVPGMPDTLYVSGDLIVPTGVTLTLNKGTVVRVAPEPISHDEGGGSDASKIEIIVEGTLKVGSAGSGNVVFESFTDTATTSDWGGITFASGSSGTLTGVVINNADVAVDVEEFDMSVADWDTNKSLYLNSALSVTSDYTVASGDSLLILGDTPVTVTGGQTISIEVNGTLISKGSATDKPEFLSSTAAARSWEWIAFNDSSTSNVFHNTAVKHAKLVRTYVPLAVDSCTFSNGATGVQSYDSLHITNSTISNMSSDGIHVVKGSADIANVEIYDSDFGLSLSDSTTVVCEDSYIHDITYYGVSASGSEVDLTLKRSQIQDAAEGCRLTLHASAVVDSCQFFRNGIGVYAAVDSLLALSHCDIDSSSTNGVYLLGSANITMDADTVSGSPVGILCASASHPKIQGNGWITANNVGIKANASSPIVRDTRISANVDGVTALYSGNPDLGSTADTTCGGGGNEGVNSIHGNTGYHVVNLTPAVTILAECNWWGSAGPKASKFSGAVDYSPHRTSDPNPTSTAPPPIVDQGDDPPPRERLPETFALSRNYPNPFNPTTVLGYDVPAPGERVTIGIYNVKGQLVTTLVSGEKAPGRYTATWHGRDRRGSAVASGVYFVRMTAGTFVQTRKIVLLK